MQCSFKFLNLHTVYGVSGAFRKAEEQHPCFRLAFCFNREQPKDKVYTNKYKIQVYTSPKIHKTRRNNFSIVNLAQYLTYLQEVVDFDFNIEKVDDDYSYINLIVNDTGYMQNYILCIVRYTYEYPYNVMLYDAMKLYESGKCPGLNIIDCFNITLANSDGSYSGEQVALWYHGDTKPMSKKEIRNILKASSRNNNTCVVLKRYETPFPVKIIQDDHLENWYNTYHRREKVYIETYNRIKKYV